MNRQLFWVYGVFITMNNIAFALLTFLWAPEIATADGLAHGFAGFVTAYWATRIAVQLFVFDRSDWPKGPQYEAAHWAFTALFAFLVGVYGSAFVGGLL